MMANGSMAHGSESRVNSSEIQGGSYPVSLVVPCYNEAARLDVGAFRRFLAEPGQVQLVFVDDGSQDETAAVLSSVCAGYEHRGSILRMNSNFGKGEAVRRGLNYALSQLRPAVAGFWDADLATPLPALWPLLQVLDARPGIDMVFGARVKLLGRRVERGPARHYLGRVFATAVSGMLRLPVYDTQCGAKVFRVTPEFHQVLATPFLSKWVFDVEMLARFVELEGGSTKRLESAIYEYPLETWEEIKGSKVRPHHFVTALLDIMRIKRKYLS